MNDCVLAEVQLLIQQLSAKCYYKLFHFTVNLEKQQIEWIS